MNELDKKIREALQGEDAEWIKQFDEEPSIFEMLLETFCGRRRWLIFLTLVIILVFFALAIFCAVRFFNAIETREMIMWAGASIFFISGVSMMKVWYWMELNKNALTREIKRLELQIARLANRIKD